MQMPNVLETPGYPDLPNGENDQVGTISRDEAAWLAGIIDGEGCIHFAFRSKKENSWRQMHFKLRIEIGSSSPHMIQRISELWFKMGFHFCYAYQKTYRRDYMRIIVQSLRGCYKLLNTVQPFMVAKKEEVDLSLEYLTWRLGTFPVHIGRNSEMVEEIRSRLPELRDKIAKFKAKRFSFQRLPRQASRPLDLSKLEVMV